jgi:hypothetical protein
MITRFGKHFEWVELWDRPDDPNHWDTRLDPEWRIFSEMMGAPPIGRISAARGPCCRVFGPAMPVGSN